MVKYLYLMSAAAYALCCGAGPSDAAEAKKAPKAATVVVEETQGKKLKHIDVDAMPGTGEKSENVYEGRVMPLEQTYNRNTGLPDVVPSDARGEIQ